MFNEPNVIGVMVIKVTNKKTKVRKDRLKFSLAPLVFKAFADRSRKESK